MMAGLHQGDDRFGRQCVANVMWALMYSTIRTPDILLTQHLDHILSQGDILYQQIGKCGQLLATDIPAYMPEKLSV